MASFPKKIGSLILAVCVLVFSLALFTVPTFATSNYTSFTDTAGTTTLNFSTYSLQGANQADMVDTDYLYQFDLPFHAFNMIPSPAGQYVNGYYNLHLSIPFTWNDPNASISGISFDWDAADGVNVIFAGLSYPSLTSMNFTVYVYFTNYYAEIRRNDLFDFIVHLSVSSQNSDLRFSSTPTLTSWDNSTTLSASPDPAAGLAGQIAYSINNATQVGNVVSILTAISSDTDLLSQVLSKVNNIDQVLTSVLSQLTYIYNTLDDIEANTDYAGSQQYLANGILTNILGMFTNSNSSNNLYTARKALQTLVYILAGDNYSTNAAALAGFQSNLQAIIEAALNSQQADSTDADSAADNVDQQQQANEQIEAAVYQGLQTNLQNVDMNPMNTFGSNIGSVQNAAYYLGQRVVDIYNQSSHSFRFLLAATLCSGLLILVLGKINQIMK